MTLTQQGVTRALGALVFVRREALNPEAPPTAADVQLGVVNFPFKQAAI